VLRRLDLRKPSFDELYLQELLRKHPTILPLNKLDASFWPPIPIGRETPLGAGCCVDNLYVSPTGGLTLVEAKLWKNPAANRDVVGQVIDYAKQLARWGYSDVDRACRQYTGRYAGARQEAKAARDAPS